MSENASIVRRLLVAVDAAGYGGQHERRQTTTQQVLLDILDGAAERAGLARSVWTTQSGGDGELAVLPAEEPEGRVVDDFVHWVCAGLVAHNEPLQPHDRLRLRLAVHHGVATPSPNGFTGQGPVVVSRLLDADVARRALLASEKSDLVVILSDRVFEDTVVQRRTSLRSWDFREVTVINKELRTRAWLRVPGDDVSQLDLGPEPDPEVPPEPPRRERATGAERPHPAGPDAPADGGHYATTVNGNVAGSVIGRGDVHHHGPS